jgi:SAM-dependent methyltransferase
VRPGNTATAQQPHSQQNNAEEPPVTEPDHTAPGSTEIELQPKTYWEPSEPVQRHVSAELALGTVGIVKRAVDAGESRVASRAWWDADADDYQAEHGDFLGTADFVWCPEGVREEDVRLLGDIAGRRVLEVGCGSAACARWLGQQGANVVALDLSSGMLAHAAAENASTGVAVPLIQASADQLPFADGSFDSACSAFGAVPFVADSGAVLNEVARVLRPGGSWVFAVTHPMRWIFPDDPGPEGLTVVQSYFDRTPYLEVDDTGRATYVEHHRTLGDYVRQIRAAGMVLDELIEPEWPEGHAREWGQWSPLRGRLFPGTAIFCCTRV